MPGPPEAAAMGTLSLWAARSGSDRGAAMDPGPIGRGGVWGPWHLPEQGRGSVLVLKAGEPCASGTDICALKSWLSPAMASRSPQTLATGDMGCPQSPRARSAVDCVILASFVPKGCGWHCAYRPHGDPVSLGVTHGSHGVPRDEGVGLSGTKPSMVANPSAGLLPPFHVSPLGSMTKASGHREALLSAVAPGTQLSRHGTTVLEGGTLQMSLQMGTRGQGHPAPM